MASIITVSYSELDTADLAWLAGFLEGEGSFIWYRNKGRQYARVQVNSTDRDVLDRAARLMGGNGVFVEERGRHKTAYKTKVTGARAVELMRVLLPLMGDRRSADIRTILEAACPA